MPPCFAHLRYACYGLLALLPALLQAAPASESNSATLRAHKVAQVVHGILSYTRWPQQPKTLHLCIIAPTEYADLLWQDNHLETPQPVQTTRLLSDSPLLETDCQAVYLGVLGESERQALFARLVGKPILTISETTRECSEGSLFCLGIADERVAFKVNLDTVARSGLRIHPNVLQLGKRAEAQQ